MTQTLPSSLSPETRCRLVLGRDLSVTGTIVASDNGWIRMQTARGQRLVALEKVLWIELRGEETADTTEESDAEDCNVDAAQLRPIITAIIDGVKDVDIARSLGLDRTLIRHVRLAFEAARGDREAKELPSAAKALVESVRQIASGR
jgi:hypothetical protein